MSDLIDVDGDGYTANYDDCNDYDSTALPLVLWRTIQRQPVCKIEMVGNATPENDAVEPGTDCDDANAAVNPAEGNCTDLPE